MSCVLTQGRTNPCNDNIGGIKYVYLFNYTDNNDIIRLGQEIISFPPTTIYLFEQMGAVYNENITNNENGPLFTQSLNFRLKQQDISTTNRLNELKDIDLRAIIQMHDGRLRILGLYQGLRLNTLNIESGGLKSDFIGYNITLTGNEEISAPYLQNLDDFNMVEFLLLEDLTNLLLEDGERFRLEINN